MESLKFKPAEGCIAVAHMSSAPTTETGIILSSASTVDKYPAKGVIAALGVGMEDSGYEVGDIVVYNGYTQEDLIIDGDKYDIVGAHFLLGKYL